MKELNLLLGKNLKVQWRNRMRTAGEILMPAAAVLCMALIHGLMKVREVPEPVISDSFSVKELSLVMEDETSVLYYGPTNDLVDSIIQTMDAKFFKPRGLNYEFKPAPTMARLVESYNEERSEWFVNTTTRGPILGAVYFDSLNWGVLTNDITYTIRLPSTQRTMYSIFSDRGGLKASWYTELNFPFVKISGPRGRGGLQGGFPGYFDEGFMYLQYALDYAIMEHLSNTSNTDITPSPGPAGVLPNWDLQLQKFPFPAYKDDKFDFVIAVWSPLILGIAFALPIMNLTRQIVHDKSTRLKEFLVIMGLKSGLHWIAWFLQAYLTLIISMLVLTVAVKIPIKGLSYLEMANPLCVFIAFTAFSFVIIGYSFLFSTLFSSPEAGATAAGFSWIMTTFLYIKLTGGYEQHTNDEKISNLFLGGGPMILGILVFQLANRERLGVGLQWENFMDGETTKDDLSVGVLVVAMLIAAALYILLALYIELAFPGPYGVRLPWYFPLTLRFWTGSGPSSNSVSSSSAVGTRGTANHIRQEPEPTGLIVGVELKGLTKAFGSRSAVSNVSLRIYQNQVTALLGPNGAGKTSIISMITGLIRPSSGTATVNGYDISTDMRKVRSNLGYCPQHSILFDNLTVEEHFKFYCAVKGLDKGGASEETERYLAMLGLEDQRDTQAKNLSAGTKRKLCVCIAFCAGSKVVLLDEPTAGMDPVGRQSTWDIILSEKRNRTVILSTHYMEEADLLSDRIAILAEGKIQCCGSPVFLKRELGLGLKLNITASENGSLGKIKDVITKSVRDGDVEFVHDSGQEIKCTLPVKIPGSFGALFEELESKKEELGMTTFGVSPPTMEQVFVRVIEDMEKAKNRKGHSLRSGNDVTVGYIESSFGGGVMGSSDSFRRLCPPPNERNQGWVHWLQQLKAMVVKRGLMTLRNPGLLALQILAPPLLIMMVQWTLTSLPGTRPPVSRLITIKDYELFGHPTVILACEEGCKSVCQTVREIYNDSKVRFEELDEFNPIISYLLDKTEESLWRVTSDYLFAVEAKNMTYSEGENNNNNNASTQVTIYFNNQMFHLPPLAVNMVSNMLLATIGSQARISVTNHPFDYMPEEEAFNFPGFANVYFMGVSLIAGGGLLWASFLIPPTYERITGFKKLQQLAGVGLGTFWIAELLISVATGLAGLLSMTLVLRVVFYRSLFDWHMQWPFFVLGLTFLAAAIPSAMVYSLFQTSAANGFGKLLAFSIVSAIVALCTRMVFPNPEFDLTDISESVHQALLPLPTYAFGNGVTRVVTNYDLYRACHKLDLTVVCEVFPFSLCCSRYRENFFANDGYGCGPCINALLVFGLISLILLVLLEWDVLRGLKRLLQAALCCCDSKTAPLYSHFEPADPEVSAERRRIENQPTKSLQDPLVIRNLTKTLKGGASLVSTEAGEVIVGGLSFGVQEGQVFGLLGRNGCGKTTVFKMLTQGTSISSGDAFIKSYSVSKETREAQKHLGYCPQTDTLLEELTGRETLALYARLRGVREEKVPELVSQVASILMLSKYLDQQIGKYSGGNKRKLSIALATLGYPPVLILDEPTAGIDPLAKFHVWEAVEALRGMGTSILLASQDINECEALCSRLGIISNGVLQCIGSPQSLKSNISQGYNLLVQLPTSGPSSSSYTSSSSAPHASSNGNYIASESNDRTAWLARKDDFAAFINKRLPGCELRRGTRLGYLEYFLPAEKITWSAIFRTMEDATAACLIEGFLVSQADLRQVFFAYA